MSKAEIISNVSAHVKPVFILDSQRKLVINGKMEVDSWWVAAREIIFKPGAELVFSNSATIQSRELFIVADKIVIENPLQPPTITWIKCKPATPDDRGQAQSGPAGNGAGAAGQPGYIGSPGAPGARGTDAPNLTLMVRSLTGALSIDFRGAPGGDGGVGQRGGNGGAGAQGTAARQARHDLPFNVTVWDPWCECGPGEGGPGGSGGNGGGGGIGGTGGIGGSITLVSTEQALPTLTQAIRVDIGGGFGGNAGRLYVAILTFEQFSQLFGM